MPRATTMPLMPRGGWTPDQRWSGVARRIPRVVRDAVRKRDGYACMLCRAGKPIDVHHMDGRNEYDLEPNHDPSNLVTLCRRCHVAVHFHGVRLTWRMIERAARIRTGEEVLYVRTAEDPDDSLLIGDRMLMHSIRGRPEVVAMLAHPEWRCPPECMNCKTLGLEHRG